MKFIFATLHVKNLEESIQFYENIVGMKLARRFPGGPHTEIVFMADGPAEIELICNTEAEPVVYGECPSLGLSVEDLDQGVEIVSGPFQPNPNTRFFFIHDPDGVNLEIIEKK